MSRTTYHMCIDVRGFLLHAKPREYKGLFRDDSGRVLSPEEAKAQLLDELALGHEKIPCGPCEGFDYVKGCPGHVVSESDAR